MVVRLSALRTGRFFPPPPRKRKYSWYSFLLRGWVDPRAIVRSEWFCQGKMSMTPVGIEPATFRFVAQHHHETLYKMLNSQHVDGCNGCSKFWLRWFVRLHKQTARKLSKLLRRFISASSGAKNPPKKTASQIHPQATYHYVTGNVTATCCPRATGWAGHQNE